MEEIWKDINGFEGRYQVSNLGRVRSLGFTWKVFNYKSGRYLNIKREGRIRKLIIGKKWGYYMVNLANSDGQIKTYIVHKLVAMAFLPNPDNLPEINHKDENKLNNVVCINPDGSIDTERTNLEWCTGFYNLRYGTRTERVHKKVNEPRMRAIDQFDIHGKFIRSYESQNEASRDTGISRRSIWEVLKQKRKNIHGYVFSYSDTGNSK